MLTSLLIFKVLSISPIFLIFLDYHKKQNIFKAFVFVGAILGGLMVVKCLIFLLGLWCAPLFALAPFAIALTGNRRQSYIRVDGRR